MSERVKEEYPEAGELIIGTVDSIFNQGAFITLDEYGNKKGMLHLTEISPKWVRNIRDYVREGQKVVLLVLKVNPGRGHIDLSLRRVADSQRKEKLQEVKQKQRSEKLIDLLGEEITLTESDKKLIKSEILSKFESLYAFLESVAADESVIDMIKLKSEWKPAFLELIKNNIVAPLVSITGYLELKTYAEDGLDHLKESLKIMKNQDPEKRILVSYVSAPLYRITVTAEHYKAAEKLLRQASDAGIDYLMKHKGHGEFHRKLEGNEK